SHTQPSSTGLLASIKAGILPESPRKNEQVSSRAHAAPPTTGSAVAAMGAALRFVRIDVAR
ncbi:MAG: hypothetical protein OEN20_10060, partial [Gammaproteobacteria bacterium]|nr:hypothetical protein [Gammaproteobacteria bacterium]